jgi:glyoxylase-like metal-dependent hydrolase (beta-lactamase superfamily II)/rhodanese-related sulfurtransferase
MYFEQFYLTCLAHASYMIGSEGEAAVVDPQRDVDIYLTAAEEQKLTIRHIFETHLHADFVSGHKELAARAGAKIYIGAKADAGFPHVALKDGYEVKMGAVRIRALETPGHTPESVCLVVIDDSDKTGQPSAVLTGDTLFIGDVGRPDLSRTHTPRQLAGLLYDSLHQKLLALPDAVKVYPAHGAGSLCGRAMRAERSSTIGTERLTNYALQIPSREQFIAQLTTNLPARPEYFLEDAEINRSGATSLTELPPPPALSPAEVAALLGQDGTGKIDVRVNVLDVRPGDEFAAGHVAGSISIALSGQFASWAGGILGIHSKPVLIGDSDTQIEEARLRLARVGIEDLRGYLAGGLAAWRKAGLPLITMPQISPAELNQKLRAGNWRAADILDVRREGEWQAGHIGDVQCRALDTFPQGLPEIDRERPVAVHCKSGYRSLIACSLLERAGHRNVVNVTGGFDAWHAAGLPEVAEQLAKV